ncbi:VanZ family protein [Planococcus lenghuensis]|uniref:VanZ-like domain-containing protein n=1 Tax=Planococcus lenghuensis TaxID=2213202 RepID=A0A1Q2L0Z2_9BACL|nr:VanZ family protein [Planococcus lenghuensis]AQQ54044.1 hypothetical protein B0X71_13670 [Planococcus lenghuensis]
MNKTYIFSWVPVLLWMALIFFLSGQQGSASGGLSSGITGMVMNTIESVLPFLEIDPEQFHTFIRKCAHFIAYLILAVLALYALRQSGIHGIRSIFSAFIIAVLYAISDEYHQSFVPGRGPAVTDVLIDSAGAAAGIGLYFWRTLFRKPRPSQEVQRQCAEEK